MIDGIVKLFGSSPKVVKKEIIKKSPLIDWVWLLVLAIVALATEWFTRKYNGLL